MADLEIQKEEFKVVCRCTHIAPCRISCFCRGSGGMLPTHNYFSATEQDSPYFHEQTSTKWRTKVSHCDVLKVQISSCTFGK